LRQVDAYLDERRWSQLAVRGYGVVWLCGCHGVPFFQVVTGHRLFRVVGVAMPRHTFSAMFGAVIARGLDYRETFQHFRPGFDLTQERERRAAAGEPERSAGSTG
jgi:hypothetical protein